MRKDCAAVNTGALTATTMRSERAFVEGLSGDWRNRGALSLRTSGVGDAGIRRVASAPVQREKSTPETKKCLQGCMDIGILYTPISFTYDGVSNHSAA